MLYPVSQRLLGPSSRKACVAEWCSLTLFSPFDGWVILYTINPSICQLLMEILGLGVVGWFDGAVKWLNATLDQCWLELQDLSEEKYGCGAKGAFGNDDVYCTSWLWSKMSFPLGFQWEIHFAAVLHQRDCQSTLFCCLISTCCKTRAFLMILNWVSKLRRISVWEAHQKRLKAVVMHYL